MALNLRNSHATAWLVPMLYAFGSLLLGFTLPRLANNVLPGFLSSVSANAAIGIYSAVASGMIALTGIVFSLTFLMVQFSATAYSPRLVVWIARDPVMSHSMGVFTATFLYAIAALAWVDRRGFWPGSTHRNDSPDRTPHRQRHHVYHPSSACGDAAGGSYAHLYRGSGAQNYRMALSTPFHASI
jgi:hypothetical protein